MSEAPVIKEHRVDRSGWQRGPWDSEPEDRIEWRSADGVPCLMVRNRLGAWCGYAAVAPEHPWHGKGYDDIPVEVHGGLTYADKCQADGGPICHVPLPGEPDPVVRVRLPALHGQLLRERLDFAAHVFTVAIDPVVVNAIRRPWIAGGGRTVMSDELPDPCFIDDIAAHLRVSTRTLERRIARGLSMPRELRRIGHRRRWAKDDVLAWLTRDDEQPKARPHFRSHLRVAQGGMR